MSKIIVLDGCDGVGKTAAIAAIKEYLEGLGKTVFVTRAIGSDTFGNEVRKELFKDNNDQLGLNLLAAVCNWELYCKTIPSRNEDFIIIDRWISTYYSYQHFLPVKFGTINYHGLTREVFNHIYKNSPTPDIFFYMYTDEETARKRLSGRMDLNHLDNLNFETKVQGYESFLFLAQERYNIVRIDATPDMKIVHEKMLDSLCNLISDQPPYVPV